MDVTELRPLLPNAITPTADSGDQLQGASATASDFESFLKLLTAQLRNQDPLSPLDSTEFVAQLASFSSVEQQIATNERLDQIVEQAVNGDIASFATWIGRSVSTVDGMFRATGEEVSFKVPEDQTAETATAVVRQTDGRELRRLPVEPSGSAPIVWDGEDAEGNLIAGQELKIEIEYYSGGTLNDTRPALVSSVVTGIRGTGDGIDLDLSDGRRIPASSVASLELADSASNDS